MRLSFGLVPWLSWEATGLESSLEEVLAVFPSEPKGLKSGTALSSSLWHQPLDKSSLSLAVWSNLAFHICNAVMLPIPEDCYEE